MAKAIQCDRCKAFTSVSLFPLKDPKDEWKCIAYDINTDTQTVLCTECHKLFVRFMAGESVLLPEEPANALR